MLSKWCELHKCLAKIIRQTVSWYSNQLSFMTSVWFYYLLTITSGTIARTSLQNTIYIKLADSKLSHTGIFHVTKSWQISQFRDVCEKNFFQIMHQCRPAYAILHLCPHVHMDMGLAVCLHKHMHAIHIGIHVHSPALETHVEVHSSTHAYTNFVILIYGVTPIHENDPMWKFSWYTVETQ